MIANIAVSDILLCVFTMPLSLLDMIHNYWPLGSGQVSPTLVFILWGNILFFRKFCVNSALPPSLHASFSAPTQLPSSQLTGKYLKNSPQLMILLKDPSHILLLDKTDRLWILIKSSQFSDFCLLCFRLFLRFRLMQ